MRPQWTSWSSCLLTALVACAGSSSAPETPTSRRARRASHAAGKEAQGSELDPLARAVAAQDAPQSKLGDRPDQPAEKREKSVAVQGIEGTLSPFDVRMTMEKQSKAFAKCHEPRARKVPALGGAVEFRVHVLRTGEVSEVNVRVSDLGDRVLERCLSEVIAAAKFPAPHGGEADVTWNMALAAQRGRAPEQWSADHVERVRRKNTGDLLETCDAKRAGPMTVTAYVSSSGRVLAAGVAASKPSSQEHLDCIADELRTWAMPKARKGVAKVSFPLRG